MTFHHLDAIAGAIDPVSGFERRIAHGDSMTLAFVTAKAGECVPSHAHPNEQCTLLLDGEFEMTIGAETRQLIPGAFAIIPANAPHAGRAVTDCAIIEIFSPRREDFSYGPRPTISSVEP